MPAITYRSFLAADAQTVQAVAREAWRHAYPHLFSPRVIDDYIDTHYAPEALRALVPDLESGKEFFQVAVDGAQIIGFCHMGLTDRGAQLFRIYLRPGYLRQGIGRHLLELGEAFLRARGVERYFCYVNKGNRVGQQFYDRQGFRRLPEEDLADSYCMEKLLI
jgi:ribosomal protein S18 acetylase RimI-like enzyme